MIQKHFELRPNIRSKNIETVWRGFSDRITGWAVNKSSLFVVSMEMREKIKAMLPYVIQGKMDI
jgi:hypothetical protein